MVSHLVNVSAYPFDLERYGGRDGLRSLLDEHRLDGLEMLTGHFPVPQGMEDMVAGVHLPYCVDWYSVWNGDAVPDPSLSLDDVRFLSYGKDRDDVVRCIRDAMQNAVPLGPAYGVFHAGAPDLDRIFSQSFSRTDSQVISALTELLNETVSGFPGGEPPFPIMLENLWWPGLRLLEPHEFSLLDDGLEFEGWGICLDVGHLMNAMRSCRDEGESIESVISHLRMLPSRIIDRIKVIHLHLSLSSQYQGDSMSRGETEAYMGNDVRGKLNEAFPHFSAIDWHAPFRDPRCREIINISEPDFVTHEFISPHVEDLKSKLDTQLSHFRCPSDVGMPSDDQTRYPATGEHFIQAIDKSRI